MREAVKEAKQYQSELQALRSFSNGDSFVEKQIKILEKTSKSGITSLQVLNQDFNISSEKILKISRQENPDKTILDKAALKFSNVVHVRKITADETSKKTEDIIARASKAIELGNIDLALKEISELSSSHKELLNIWSEKAKDFITTQKASEEIFQYVINFSNKNMNITKS